MGHAPPAAEARASLPRTQDVVVTTAFSIAEVSWARSTRQRTLTATSRCTNSPEFRELRRQSQTFTAWVSGIFYGWWFLVILLAAFAPGFYRQDLVGPTVPGHHHRRRGWAGPREPGRDMSHHGKSGGSPPDSPRGAGP
ncbi:DUF485 domain-containing protein [Streptomyces sp. NPDC052079]|uniref:DUF485 domain-containing protein n=1 Tax=Streptomyces sp. NPDC052079 TaxID=3155526 RepID=UPI0034277936